MFDTNPRQDSTEFRIESTVGCPDCKRAKKFFGEPRSPYLNIDIEKDPQAKAYVEKVNQEKGIIPALNPTFRGRYHKHASLDKNLSSRTRRSGCFSLA